MEKSWSLMPPAAWCSPVLATRSSKRKRTTGWRFLSLLAGLWLLWASPAHAVDMLTALENLRHLVIPLTQLLLAFSFVTGIFFIFKAIGLMKKFGMMNSMQAQPGEFLGPISYLLIGALLIWIPTTSTIMSETIFGSSAPQLFGQGSFDYSALGSGAELLAYMQGSSLQTQWTAVANTLVLYIQFIGLIAFIRGWIIVAKSAQPGHQPGSMAKGVTHIIGGIIAMNFVQFINLVRATLGM